MRFFPVANVWSRHAELQPSMWDALPKAPKSGASHLLPQGSKMGVDEDAVAIEDRNKLQTAIPAHEKTQPEEDHDENHGCGEQHAAGRSGDARPKTIEKQVNGEGCKNHHRWSANLSRNHRHGFADNG